jgi:hypothetical protein
MKCFRCFKNIEKKDDYYTIIRNSKGVKVSADFVHKDCWDGFIKRLDGADESLKKSNFLLNALGRQMNKLGMIPDREVVLT